jgi:hypothetical protein
METPNPKCGTCKCYWKPDETDIKPSGLQYKTCKKCRENGKKYYEENPDKIKEQSKKYKEENADKIKQNMKKWREENADKIKEKNKKYYEENVDKHKERHKKYYEENVDKLKEQVKKYYENNADKERERHKKYREENADKERERKKKYREENPNKNKEWRKENADKIKEKLKKWREENKCEHNKRKSICKECNLQLYLVNLQRAHLKRCIKLSNLSKTKPSIEYLGCNAEHFIEYFKKKMDLFNQYSEIEMTWDNIHIDHIKPVSSFNLDDEEAFLSCCNYTNLQPLLAEVNLNKSHKWSDEDDIFWLDNIKDKEYYDIYLPV